MSDDAHRWGWDADTIRALRIRLLLTNEAFARLLGVSLRTVNRWQAGEESPSPLAREKLDALEAKAQQNGGAA